VARLTRYATALAVVGLAAAALGVGRADAGLLGCAYPAVSQPFAAWGDLTKYYLSPGGGFESSGWKFGSGASVVPGNESFYVNGGSDSHALTLAPGATAQSPYSCITALDLKVRMFVRSDANAPVRIDVVVPTLLGLLKVATPVTVQATTDWQPTSAIVNLANLLSATMLGGSNIGVRVTAVGSAPVQVDDVFIDPTWYY
jgi:hypothetical protein